MQTVGYYIEGVSRRQPVGRGSSASVLVFLCTPPKGAVAETSEHPREGTQLLAKSLGELCGPLPDAEFLWGT